MAAREVTAALWTCDHCQTEEYSRSTQEPPKNWATGTVVVSPAAKDSREWVSCSLSTAGQAVKTVVTDYQSQKN